MTQIFDMILFKLKFCPNVLNLKVVVLKPPKEVLLLEKSEPKKKIQVNLVPTCVDNIIQT
jgi:hypothetical protein